MYASQGQMTNYLKNDSNMPLIFANGYPTRMHNLKEEQLECFLRYLWDFADVPPLARCLPPTSINPKTRIKNLRNAIRIIYNKIGCKDLLHLSELIALKCYKEPIIFKQVSIGNNEIVKLYDTEMRFIVSVPSSNLTYDKDIKHKYTKLVDENDIFTSKKLYNPSKLRPCPDSKAMIKPDLDDENVISTEEESDEAVLFEDSDEDALFEQKPSYPTKWSIPNSGSGSYESSNPRKNLRYLFKKSYNPSKLRPRSSFKEVINLDPKEVINLDSDAEDVVLSDEDSVKDALVPRIISNSVSESNELAELKKEDVVGLSEEGSDKDVLVTSIISNSDSESDELAELRKLINLDCLRTKPLRLTKSIKFYGFPPLARHG